MILISAAILAAVLSYYRKTFPAYLKLFPFFLLLTIIVELTAAEMDIRKISNTMLYNIFTTIEFTFYVSLLRKIIKNKTAKDIILVCMFVFPLLVFAEIFFWMKKNGFHSTTYALGCLIIVTICIFYFYELFKLPYFVNLKRDPPFWICCALLFFFSCTFPIYAFANFLNNLPVFISSKIELILDIINSLFYSLLIVAFLCTPKASSTSAS